MCESAGGGSLIEIPLEVFGRHGDQVGLGRTEGKIKSLRRTWNSWMEGQNEEDPGGRESEKKGKERVCERMRVKGEILEVEVEMSMSSEGCGLRLWAQQ